MRNTFLSIGHVDSTTFASFGSGKWRFFKNAFATLRVAKNAGNVFCGALVSNLLLLARLHAAFVRNDAVMGFDFTGRGYFGADTTLVPGDAVRRGTFL